MKMLIAVEDKKFGDAIAEFVCNRQDWGTDAEFRIIHVVEPVYLGAINGYPTDVLTSHIEECKTAGKHLVRAIGAELQDQYPKATILEEVVEGHPKEVIIDTAKSWHADLIIVGSHGRSGLAQFLLGSVSMSVLSAAPCSVLIVKLPSEKLAKVEKGKQTTTAK